MNIQMCFLKLARAGLPKDWDVPEGGAKLLLLMTLPLQGQAHSGPSAATGGMELDPPHPWKGCNLCAIMTCSCRLPRV